MKLIEAILTYGKKIFIDKNFKNDNSLDMFLHKIYPKQIITRDVNVLNKKLCLMAHNKD